LIVFLLMRGCRGCPLGKWWSTSLRNLAPMFVTTLQEKGGLNQVILRLPSFLN
jgi:hypothetical protein